MFVVVWDNGVNACGELPDEFSSWEEAEAYGSEWARESNIRDGISLDAEDAYSYDIVQLEVNDE